MITITCDLCSASHQGLGPSPQDDVPSTWIILRHDDEVWHCCGHHTERELLKHVKANS